MSSEEIQISVPLLLEFSSNLSASPRIFARLSKLIENEDTGLDYVASIVKMDPSLAAHILRGTNSAYYGSAIKLNDIESAIARIGFNEVHKVLSVVIAHDSFYQALPVYGVTATEYADDCIATAVASEVISMKVGMDINAPYITGLLHGIGKLAINLYIEKLGKSSRLIDTKNREIIYREERNTFGITSLKAGSELLKHWQFESEIWLPIRRQNDPMRATNYIRQTAILTLALWGTDNLGAYDSEATLPKNITWALKELNIDRSDVPSLMDEIRFEFNDRQNLFSMLI